MLTALLILTLGCTTTTTTTVSVCTLEVTETTPAEAAAGESVVLTASPTTTVFDSLVTVAGVSADITDITRTECEACDACREVNACLACGDCDVCDVSCAAECVETVTFTMPSVGVGVQPVQLLNAYGASQPVDVTVLDVASDTGDTDTGAGGK